jgi:hypothetical protein
VKPLPHRQKCEGNFSNFLDFESGTVKILIEQPRIRRLFNRPLLCSGPAVLREQSVGFFCSYLLPLFCCGSLFGRTAPVFKTVAKADNAG